MEIVCEHGVEHKVTFAYVEQRGDVLCQSVTQTYCAACVLQDLVAAFLRGRGDGHHSKWRARCRR